MIQAFEWTVAWRYLRARRREGFISVVAWFSLIGIMLGVATLIVTMSVMHGFRHELLGRILGMNGHIGIVSAKDARLTDFDKYVEKIRALPHVKVATPFVEREAVLTARKAAVGVRVLGMRAPDLQNKPIIADHLRAGDLSKLSDEKMPGVAVGVRLAQKLHIGVGDKISLMTLDGQQTPFGTMPRIKAFPVTAIFDAGVNEYDSRVIYMDLAAAQQYFNMGNTVSNIEVFLQDPEEAYSIARQIFQALGAGVHVVDWQHSNSTLFSAVIVERNVMFLVLSLIILIAAFNIISTLIMLVSEKVRDIAILRTMGAKRGAMLRVFIYIGACVGVVGTALGLGLGVLVTKNIENIRQGIQVLVGHELFSAEIYYLTRMPAIIDWSEVIGVMIMAISLSLLATLYPAWRAASLDPVEALRQ